MKIFKMAASLMLVALSLTSCYDNYVEDYEFKSAYFGSQNPLRTIVAREQMEFEVGVTLSGMRVDEGQEWVNFSVDTTLLHVIPEANAFTLLPSSYYSLSDESKLSIVKDHMRTVKVTLNRDKFTEDQMSLSNTYAIPLRITSASVDSIPGSELDTATIVSRDITILVVKYISQYHGYYYSKGMQVTLDDAGLPVDTVLYSQTDLSTNDVVDFSTISVNTVSTSRIGGDISGSLELTVNDDNSVVLSSSDVVLESTSTVSYSVEEETFTLDLNLTKSGVKYHITEELILRQKPESDLRFEEW